MYDLDRRNAARTHRRYSTSGDEYEDRDRQEDQQLDPAHGADSHASWAALRESNIWVDP